MTIAFSNKGKAKHNLHVLDKKDGKTLAPGAEGKIIDGGQSDVVKFTAPAVGKYYFQCDLHPDQMFGEFNAT